MGDIVGSEYFEEGVETIGDKELPNEKYIDEDAVYEKYRDDAGECLDDALNELIKSFINGHTGYYTGEEHKEKLLEHMIVSLEFKLEQLKKEVKQ